MHFLPDAFYASLCLLAAFLMFRQANSNPSCAAGRAMSWRRKATWFAIAIMSPALAQAQTVDLRTATESGNAIIMYLSGAFAAVGIVAAGVAMMTGRQSIAKWAFAGAMVSGLAFAIVRTMWSNMGLEAADVGSF
jgi:hypothetical protein